MAGGAAAASAVSLRELSFDDYAQVAALSARHGLGTRPEEEWRHAWLNNPEYRHGSPLGWVLETADGRIVGSMANIPLACEFRGRRLRVATGRAWAADPEYRGYAAVLLDELFRQNNVDLFLNTTLNRHASAAYSMFDSPRVPAGAWNRSGYWITNHRGFAASALAARENRFATVLSWPAGLALAVRDRVRHANAVPAAGGFEVRFETGFDHNFDAFWEELRLRNPEVLLSVRDRATLQWHFRYHLERDNVWIVTAW